MKWYGGLTAWLLSSFVRDTSRMPEGLGREGRRLIGARIRALRGDRSQEDLAQQAGISDGTLSAIERGRSDPRLGTLLRLAQALGLSSVEELLGPLPTSRYLTDPGEDPTGTGSDL